MNDPQRRPPVQLARLLLALVALSVASPALAASGGAAMPWDTALTNLSENISGPTARALIIIAVVVTGLAWAFTEHGTGGRRVSQIAFGGAVALAAVAFLANLGITGATV